MWSWLIAAILCVVLIAGIVGMWVLIPLLVGMVLRVRVREEVEPSPVDWDLELIWMQS